MDETHSNYSQNRRDDAPDKPSAPKISKAQKLRKGIKAMKETIVADQTSMIHNDDDSQDESDDIGVVGKKRNKGKGRAQSEDQG